MSIDFTAMIMALLGGLAIFLYGMDKMSDALKVVAGDGLKEVLKKLTNNRFAAAATGAGVTAIIQSSSVTTVLVVGFISAGVMSLQQSIGIIMGANIGTTITAQVIAFKVTKYSLALVFLGWFPLFFIKREKIKQIFVALMGLGLIFLGMTLMSDATKPLRSYEPFIELMGSLQGVSSGVLIGALFTAIVQSSSATTGVVIMLASQGLLPLEAGIAIILGANIGTCVTACLASIGKQREAVQAVLVHVLFNVIGVLLWLGLISQMAQAVVAFSPQSPELIGMDRLAAETPRQIANAHTLFNVANTLILIAFTTPLAKFVQWVLPVQSTTSTRGQAQHLDHTLLETPSIALDMVQKELLHHCRLTGDLIRHCRHAILETEHADLSDGRQLEMDNDQLHGQLITYLGRLSQAQLSQRQVQKVMHYMSSSNDLESLADTISNHSLKAAQRIKNGEIKMSDSTQTVFSQLFSEVEQSFLDLIKAIQDDDASLLQDIIERKNDIFDLAEHFNQRLAERLTASEPQRLETYRLETDLSEMIKRIYYLTKRIAKTHSALISQRT